MIWHNSEGSQSAGHPVTFHSGGRLVHLELSRDTQRELEEQGLPMRTHVSSVSTTTTELIGPPHYYIPVRARHAETEAEHVSTSPPVRFEDILLNTAVYAPCSRCGQIIASTDVCQHICPRKGGQTGR
jgi:hypothetical protein